MQLLVSHFLQTSWAARALHGRDAAVNEACVASE